MCGICGVILPDGRPTSLDLLQRMSRTMRHRGPDEEGYHQAGGAALGFQRLAIIDLSGGHQPMSNDDQSLWITFNGEIYNFQSLRQELEATGRHHFKTRSDTEVILRLYEEYGEECLRYLRGMFSFAIWDQRTRRLFAARDRFGKKPFFYFSPPGGGIAYASELKALRQHPDCPSTVDLQAIHLYLSLQYIPAPKTIFAGVFKLPAAHALSWSEKEGLKVRRYWDLAYEPKESLTYEEAKERLKDRLRESVRLRMIADVPLGAFLSGGIDSSIIVALMAQESSLPVKTFSIGFEESSYSELAHARKVADKFHTDHHEFIVKPELVDVLPKLAWFYSEPFADSSALPSYYLARETRKFVTVALTGDGGDESFAGYLRYRALWAMQFWNRLPSRLRRALGAAGVYLPAGSSANSAVHHLQRVLAVGAKDDLAQILRSQEILHPEELDSLWSADSLQRLGSARAAARSMFTETLARAPGRGLLDRLMFLDLNYYLPDCLMVKIDIASMANSLETRAPFLDHVLAEEVAHWPAEWKFRPLNFSKRILKDTFAPDLPKGIIQREKQGFGVPISQWFRGPLKQLLRDVLLSPEALGRGYFRPETLRRYVDEHQTGKRERAYGLWALLMLELWHRTNTKEYNGPRE